jgi:hypothetical protein
MKTLHKAQTVHSQHHITLFTAFLFFSLSAVGVSAQFNSGLIGLSTSAPAYGFFGYASGPGAIGSPGDMWNNAPWGVSTSMSLVAADGSSTSVQWSLSSGGGVATHNVVGTYAGLLQASTSFYSGTISGLTPGSQYDLYLYEAYWGETITVNGVYFTTPGLNAGTVNTLVDGFEYDVETVVADPTGTLTFTPVTAQYGTPYITSWQLTPVPEPSLWALLGAGTVSLLFWRRMSSRVA